jgi:tetratricopeptide (TPR) repeat protein
MAHVRIPLLALLVTLTIGAVPAAAGDGGVPLYEGLGGRTRKVTTSSPEAQRYFDQGLAFLYAFNHDEAIRSFRRAAELDPKCAMAYWGVAYANGPHINNPVVPTDRAKAAWEALGKAKAAASGASSVEKALIEALSFRYADPQPEDRKPLEQAYADAMRKVWAAYPKDADVGALTAEAIADLRPWDQWQPDGTPQPGTEELVATVEATLALDPKHPLANHLMIHAVEASPHPERADAAADTLRDLQPGLGHLVHMPSHVDVRTGRWQQAVTANAKAIEADRRYTARAPEQGFYRLYMAHNHHMLTYGAMMIGQKALALRTIREMVADIPLEFFRQNAFADGFMAMPLEVLMRFGDWDAILAEPAFPDFVPISCALQHYARAVAYAAKDDIASAEKEQAAFLAARARVPADAFFGNNTGSDVLDVAEYLMRGEILYLKGEVEPGLAAMREAVAREDKLRYDEPPSWIQPVRHAYGAALLQSGRFAEAEAVFRADLAKLPENGWGLFGLERALRLQKKTAEADAVAKRFDAVWSKADVKIKSACLCLPGV